MENIELAIQAEKNYINDVVNMNPGDTRPELLNYIQQYGFNNFQEYQDAKDAYYLRVIPFIDHPTSSDDVTANLTNICQYALANKLNYFCYNIEFNQLSAFVPVNFGQEELAAQLGIQPIYGPYTSDLGKGIIITGDGDLKIGMSFPTEHMSIFKAVENKIVEYLNQYYDDVVPRGNDILINNKKVIGFAMKEYNDMTFGMFNVCFNDYMYYIDQMCVYSKVPGYIDNPNITPESMLNEIKSILNIIQVNV